MKSRFLSNIFLFILLVFPNLGFAQDSLANVFFSEESPTVIYPLFKANGTDPTIKYDISVWQDSMVKITSLVLRYENSQLNPLTTSAFNDSLSKYKLNIKANNFDVFLSSDFKIEMVEISREKVGRSSFDKTINIYQCKYDVLIFYLDKVIWLEPDWTTMYFEGDATETNPNIALTINCWKGKGHDYYLLTTELKKCVIEIKTSNEFYYKKVDHTLVWRN